MYKFNKWLVFCLLVFSVNNNLAHAKVKDGIVMGSDKAKLKLVVYFAFTCGFCAQSHETIKKSDLYTRYIEDGVLQIVYQDYLIDGLSSAASQLMHCTRSDNQFYLMNMFFTNQQKWMSAPEPLTELKRYAVVSGMKEKTIDRCLDNKRLFEDLVKARSVAKSEFGIDSVPSFILNGELLETHNAEDALVEIKNRVKDLDSKK